MSTVVYPLMRELADGWEDIFASAVCSGVRGDARHASQGGYHISRADQPAWNYSVVRADDKPGQGPADAAAAIDMTMNRRDMKLCTQRLARVWANPQDPRRKYLNAFNGWLGSGDATRYDVVKRVKKFATGDHKWHVHLEVRRRWVLVKAMVKAVLSALKGESVAKYLRSIGVKVANVARNTAAVLKPPAGPAAKPVETAPAAGTTAPPLVTRPAPAPVKGPTVPPYPGRVLARNDHADRASTHLKTWQARVIARGYRSLGATADGYFGPATEKVVKIMQRRAGVTVDGRIGPDTWPLPWTLPLGSDPVA